MWTMQNTEGFTQPELDTINAVLERIAADAESVEPEAISDAINNVWYEGIGAKALEAAARKRLGL